MASKNEEKAIKKVINDIKKVSKDIEIIVVDGSTDNTPKIAKKLGAVVIRQKPQGYGIALKKALLSATKDIIITTDCDGTYPMEDIPVFVNLINKGFDVVSGSRLKSTKKAMSLFNQIGNKIFAFIVSILYNIKITDTTTGMRAYKRNVIHSINWTENIGLSAELLFRPALRNYKIKEIQIKYKPRLGETKLNPIIGGFEILKSILKYKLIKDK